MQKTIVDMCQNCEIYQRLSPLKVSGKGPLKAVMAFKTFMKWGIDFMGPIKPTARYSSNQYILVVADYTIK
jgi:hypothetical protein